MSLLSSVSTFADIDTSPIFHLDEVFVADYRTKRPPFGFKSGPNSLGEVTFLRTYTRRKPDGTLEDWTDVCERVVNGTYRMQEMHIKSSHLGWDPTHAQRSAREMFDRMWHMKFLPPGRGLWCMGTEVTEVRKLYAALNNCGFHSTKDMDKDPAQPFCWLMDASMLGVGVGFDTKGKGKVHVSKPRNGYQPLVLSQYTTLSNTGSIDLISPVYDASGLPPENLRIFNIPDSREGWVEALRMLLESYFIPESPTIFFNYHLIRGSGYEIKGFGGKASGPRPLMEMMAEIRGVLDANVGRGITTRTIVDIQNMIGKAVVAGNVRRSAEIAFGAHDDDEFRSLKNVTCGLDPQWISLYYSELNRLDPAWKHKDLSIDDFDWALPREQLKIALDRRRRTMNHGWCSNNSVFGELGMDYTDVANSMAVNGEPGLAWLDNMRMYGRMGDAPDYKDKKVDGGNPCFSGDTLIAVADGRHAVPIKQLAEDGLDVPVYAVGEDGKVAIKWARNPRLTRESAALVRVTLDDATWLDVTPDHKMRLLDGSWKHAKDLEEGDSLPRLQKYAEKIEQGDNTQTYLRLYCDTLDLQGIKVMEHRLIAKFHQPDAWDSLYDEAKQSGWIKGGLVVHHRDFDGRNNAPDNLQLMQFMDHSKLHAIDRCGEKNGMFGRTHSEATKALIGKSSLDRWSDADWRELRQASIDDTAREKMSISASATRRRTLKVYYENQEISTDLETRYVDGKLHAVKACLICKKEMVLPWRQRHAVFCSHSCVNSHAEFIAKRKAGQNQAFAARQRDVLHRQVQVFKNLQQATGRAPLQKEWITACHQQEVPHRLRTGKSGQTSNPHVLKSFGQLKEVAETYNHRVKSVQPLEAEQPVYNLTVDDFHTVGVVTRFDEQSKAVTGVFVFQCLEQSLESKELCCLVESFPFNHETKADYLRTLKFAYLYAKTVTLGPTHWAETNRILMRNRRIGCSMSGVAQFLEKRGVATLIDWCRDGYDTVQHWDTIYSDWMAIPKSIKMTSVKPSGTVSLLAGATPGCHFPEYTTYLRRVRFDKNHSMLLDLADAGYLIEPCVGQESSTVVVTFPTTLGVSMRSEADISIWEQTSIAALLQRHWADNQVSFTGKFDPATEGPQLKQLLEHFQFQLKGISVLPKFKQIKNGESSSGERKYAQLPYEAITQAEYEKAIESIRPITWTFLNKKGTERGVGERFCDGAACVAPE